MGLGGEWKLTDLKVETLGQMLGPGEPILLKWLHCHLSVWQTAKSQCMILFYVKNWTGIARTEFRAGGSWRWNLETAQLRTFRCAGPTWKVLGMEPLCAEILTLEWISSKSVCTHSCSFSWEWLTYVLFETQFFLNPVLIANNIRGKRLGKTIHLLDQILTWERFFTDSYKTFLSLPVWGVRLHFCKSFTFIMGFIPIALSS